MPNSESLEEQYLWTSLTEAAKSNREFNELQFKYRQLAISLLLAAYGATGYLWFSSTAPPVPVAVPAVVLPGPASAVPPHGAPGGVAAQAPSVQAPTAEQIIARQQQADEAAKRERQSTLSLVMFGIGLLISFGVLTIWAIDAGVYHTMLRANFDEAAAIEQWLTPLRQRADRTSPRFHDRMSVYINGPTVLWAMSGFYFIGVLAAFAPWVGYKLTTGAGLDRWSLQDEVSKDIALLMAAFGLVWILFIRRRFYRTSARNYYPDPTPRVAPGPPASAPASPPPGTAAAGASAIHKAAADAARASYVLPGRNRIGAAVLASNSASAEQLFTGCNVDHAAPHSGTCAERNAIAAAVLAGFTTLRQVVIHCDAADFAPPCGACRQVMAEFGAAAGVELVNAHHQSRAFFLPELYPVPSPKEAQSWPKSSLVGAGP